MMNAVAELDERCAKDGWDLPMRWYGRMEAILNKKVIGEDEIESVIMECAAVADRVDWPKVAAALVPKIKDGFTNSLLIWLGSAADAAVAADEINIGQKEGA
ncbi:hypothetical protein ACFL5Q_05645 [Planctomycetota bacterium]